MRIRRARRARGLVAESCSTVGGPNFLLLGFRDSRGDWQITERGGVEQSTEYICGNSLSETHLQVKDYLSVFGILSVHISRSKK